MGLKPIQEEIIQQLIKQEALLSKLYTYFAEQFPAQQGFWTKLSKEETKHAEIITKLFAATQKGLVTFDEGKAKAPTLNVFISRLENLVAQARNGEIKLSAAFAYAIDYESSLIEKNVFSRFDSTNEKAKKALATLESATQNHVERIRAEQKSTLSK